MYLKEETKNHIESVLGKSLSEIQVMTFDDEVEYVERKNREKLRFPENMDWRFASVREPLISLGRCVTIEEIDRQIDELVKPKTFLDKIKNWRKKS